MAGGIVKAQSEVRLRRGGETAFDGFPGSEQITQAYDSEVVRERSAQQSRSAQGRCYTGDDLDLDRRILLRNLESQGGHSVHARVAAANKGDRLSGEDLLNGPAAAFRFLTHSGGQKGLVRKAITDEIQINVVARKNVALLTGAHGLEREALPFARPKADKIKLHVSAPF